jgi:hypothetical protein
VLVAVAVAVAVLVLVAVAVTVVVDLLPPPQADIRHSISTRRQSPTAQYLFFIFLFPPLYHRLLLC